MMTNQERAAVRGTMKPKSLSEKQLREIGDTLQSQAKEYYALADKVKNDAHGGDADYQRAVSKYFNTEGA